MKVDWSIFILEYMRKRRLPLSLTNAPFLRNSSTRSLSSFEINSGYIDGLGDAVEQGLVKAVGVSNYSGNCFA